MHNPPWKVDKGAGGCKQQTTEGGGLSCTRKVAGIRRWLMNRRGCVKSYLDWLSGEKLFPCKHLASCPNKKFRHRTIKESTRVEALKALAHSPSCLLLQVEEFKSQGNISYTFNPACAVLQQLAETRFSICEVLPSPPFPLLFLTQQQTTLLTKRKYPHQSEEKQPQRQEMKTLNVAAQKA